MKKRKKLRKIATLRGLLTRKFLPLMVAGIIFMGIFILVIAIGVRFKSVTHLVAVCGIVIFLFAGIVYAIAQHIVKKFLK